MEMNERLEKTMYELAEKHGLKLTENDIGMAKALLAGLDPDADENAKWLRKLADAHGMNEAEYAIMITVGRKVDELLDDCLLAVSKKHPSFKRTRLDELFTCALAAALKVRQSSQESVTAFFKKNPL